MSVSAQWGVATATPRPALRAGATASLSVAALAAVGVAFAAPLTTSIVGLVAFGIVHNFFELRYVFGRFDGIVAGRLLRLLLAGITGIALLRLAPLGTWSQHGEILVGYGLVAAVLLSGVRLRPRLAIGGLLATATALAASSMFPAYHFVVLAHVHNVVPLVFLWEWSRRLPEGRPRNLFRALQVGWVVAVPSAILLGGADALLGSADAVPVFDVDVPAVLATYTPPAWQHGILPLRFLTAFAFLQTMHYIVWCWFLPRHARDAVTSFEGATRAGHLLRGWRMAAVAVVVAAFFALLFATDYASGRSLYGAVATYHAYLEFPILLALVLRIGARPLEEFS